MTLKSRTWKDQRRHRRKVAGKEAGLNEHLKREERRGPGRPKVPGSLTERNDRTVEWIKRHRKGGKRTANKLRHSSVQQGSGRRQVSTIVRQSAVARPKPDIRAKSSYESRYLSYKNGAELL